ncbi:hypothetical protein HYPBUDRAFT_152226 [Hyphopichia burtonii NRRL Y-1933]|uniref:Uncharacterized protein n=1 Tax=Hyphopichia burtonii NRRL Y-1933 TaxID=984485 RepID=A0A1E4RNZ2_9ASCO|nr:hypothetical protein HYPBUDRAFT_152226 [Hyphopichia burtonii NRRL Y-1933]ODV68992.1 hypothetical protein HYPBUDRAFT_152226 [Hyphopichia burtonii NRRL Y-1933]
MARGLMAGRVPKINILPIESRQRPNPFNSPSAGPDPHIKVTRYGSHNRTSQLLTISCQTPKLNLFGCWTCFR